MNPRTPVVVAARRTPVATVGKGLAGVEAADLAALAAGLGVQLPGMTVDRQCGSGLEAIRIASALVWSGIADTVLAGGTESASTAPWRLARPRTVAESPRPYQRAPFAPSGFADPEMGVAADDVARHCGISRERQDAYAARSHVRAVSAAAAGRFEDELVPVAGMVRDDRPRPGLTTTTLGRFRPAFGPDGTATAGNSCGINDGAAAVAVIPESVRAAACLPGLRILGSAVIGVDPAMPGLGSVPAVEQVVKRAGLTIRLFGSLVRNSLVRNPTLPGPYGVATCAIGGGQGIAVLVGAVPAQRIGWPVAAR